MATGSAASLVGAFFDQESNLALAGGGGDAPPVSMPSEQDEQEGARVRAFPYARVIRQYVENEQLSKARNLLGIALKQPQPPAELYEWQRVLEPARVRVVPRVGFDRRAEVAWLNEHASKYRGQWVAVVGDRLLASAESARELNARLEHAAPSTPPLLFRFSD